MFINKEIEPGGHMVNNGSSSSHMELHKTHLVEMDQHVASIDSGAGCELRQD
jgi:hypothetical protein